MSDSTGSPPDPVSHDPFEVAVRGYNRSQVDDYVADIGQRVRNLEGRLSRALDEAEQLRAELAAASQPAAARPAHAEVSERIAQILKLADEEAQEQTTQAAAEITRLRSLAQQQADAIREEARDRVEQMLASARDQAESTTTGARTEAAAATRTAQAEAGRLANEAHRQAEAVLGGATA
jgi:cell division septum initiation protein DivIVA